jgi:hypothetical protein
LSRWPSATACSGLLVTLAVTLGNAKSLAKHGLVTLARLHPKYGVPPSGGLWTLDFGLWTLGALAPLRANLGQNESIRGNPNPKKIFSPIRAKTHVFERPNRTNKHNKPSTQPCDLGIRQMINGKCSILNAQ